jgi:murein L,D-transpeptidase YcbB/YkuD
MAPAEPASPFYLRLQEALQEYQQIAERGGWPSIPDGPTIRPESDDPRIAVLSQRLLISGDLRTRRSFDTYDTDLQAAVIRFQARHGLERDALVGKNTLHALNVSAEHRIAQIKLNIDRTREIFAAAPRDLLLINVPAFGAYLYRDGELAWSTKVIVGETETETPLFESTLTTVVLNPTWTVPHKIASEELLPTIRADRSFLVRGGYDLFDPQGNPVDPDSVDWSSLHGSHFPFTLVQRPGLVNELGRVKFLFPNPYSVCMHDTPKKYLFARDTRAFSHGCVRTENPLELALQVLAAEGWNSERIEDALNTGKTRSVTLAEPLPVVLAYLTAAVDADGTVHFYPDIYGKDAAALP